VEVGAVGVTAGRSGGPHYALIDGRNTSSTGLADALGRATCCTGAPDRAAQGVEAAAAPLVHKAHGGANSSSPVDRSLSAKTMERSVPLTGQRFSDFEHVTGGRWSIERRCKCITRCIIRAPAGIIIDPRSALAVYGGCPMATSEWHWELGGKSRRQCGPWVPRPAQLRDHVRDIAGQTEEAQPGEHNSRTVAPARVALSFMRSS
jgi:hypothetical protein